MKTEDKNHYCVCCGKHRSELTEIPWGCGDGIKCKPCRNIEVEEEIRIFQEGGADTDYTDNITCPNCGHENGDSWEVSDDSGEEECFNCRAKFSFERDITVTYSTKLI